MYNQRLFVFLHRQSPTKPLNDAQMRGAFLYVYVYSQNTLMERLPHFTKHYMTETDLVALLENRGLIISDETKAVRYLESIGSYRLSDYMYPFLKVPKESHQYKEETTFQQVLNLYRFDKKLRMLLLNEIEKVEIAIRRAIMNIPVQITGDIYWLTNSVHFANQRTFQETKNTIDREYTKSTEEFIKHFKNSYCDPYPPSWILGEFLYVGFYSLDASYGFFFVGRSPANKCSFLLFHIFPVFNLWQR